MAKKYYWLRLKEDFFSQPKIKKLRKIAGGDTYTIIYLKMQLLSLNTEGNLYFEGIEDDFIEELALTIDEDVDNVKFTVMYLINQHLLEEVQKDEFSLPEAKIAIGTQSESTQRVRRLRERRKQEKALQCNVDVTKSNTEIEIDIEKEIEIKKDIDKEIKKKKKTHEDVFLEMKVSDNLKNSLKDFIDTRKSMKAPMTVRALELAILKLRKLSNSEITQIAIIEQSIMNGYKGLFELKETKQTPMQRNQDFGNDAEWDAIDIQEQEKTKNGQLF